MGRGRGGALLIILGLNLMRERGMELRLKRGRRLELRLMCCMSRKRRTGMGWGFRRMSRYVVRNSRYGLALTCMLCRLVALGLLRRSILLDVILVRFLLSSHSVALMFIVLTPRHIRFRLRLHLLSLSRLPALDLLTTLADIGGGSTPNDTRYALSNIPLQWMIKEILLANAKSSSFASNDDGTSDDGGPGILFNEDDPRFKELGIVLHPEVEHLGQAAKGTAPTKDHVLGHDYVRLAHLTGHRDGPIGPSDSSVLPPAIATATSISPSNTKSNSHPHLNAKCTKSDHFDHDGNHTDTKTSPYLPVDAREQDVLGPMHDKLSKSPAWWIVEFLPFVYSKQDASGVWRNSVRCVCYFFTIFYLLLFAPLYKTHRTLTNW